MWMFIIKMIVCIFMFLFCLHHFPETENERCCYLLGIVVALLMWAIHSY